MADVLVRLETTPSWDRGDIVEVRESGRPRGQKETPPTFGWIECPEVTDWQSHRHRHRPWYVEMEWEVVRANAAQDSARLRLWSTTQSPSGGGKLTRERVEAFLGRWNAAIHSVDADLGEIEVDVSVYGLATSPGFWGANIPAERFTEDSYDRTSGVHQITFDYSGLAVRPRVVARQVEKRGGTVLANASGQCTYTIRRRDLLPVVRSHLRDAAGSPYRVRRHRVDEATCTAIETAGGVLEMTAAALVSAITDKAAADG